jgi:protein-disulfide isomerase
VPNVKTIVEVVDFECPFCREMHHRVSAAISKANVPVQVVRKMFPLSMHPHAMPAAIAWCCADAQGKGEEMAAALFAADPATLTPKGCRQLAIQIGCDPARYDRDVSRMQSRVETEVAEARAAGIRSLPTIYVDGEPIIGASATTEQLVAMLQR